MDKGNCIAREGHKRKPRRIRCCQRHSPATGKVVGGISYLLLGHIRRCKREMMGMYHRVSHPTHSKHRGLASSPDDGIALGWNGFVLKLLVVQHLASSSI